LCPGCLAAPPPPPPPRPTVAEAQRRRRGQSLAALVHQYEDELKPLLVEWLAPAIGEIASAVTNDKGVR
jgi:hypothetical protein